MKRILLIVSILLSQSLLAQWQPSADVYSPKSTKRILNLEQKKAFNHFWTFSNPDIGMIHASSNINNQSYTIGGSGFGVMVTLVGIERGWIKREEGADRILKLVRFLKSADRIHGAWSHWVDKDGKPIKFGKQIESGDLVETSFMMMGLLAAKQYLNGNNAVEKEIRNTTDEFWNTIEWNFYTDNSNQLYWLWERTNSTYTLPIKGYNEALITYLLALAAPKGNAISSEVYTAGWQQEGKMGRPNRKHYGYPLTMGAPFGGPMFLSHYTFLGLNPKKMEDEFANYYHNGIHHAMINRHYCIEEAPKEYKYDEFNWGLSACNGPKGKGYKARSPRNDDGVIAPTAAISSLPYVPFYSMQVLLNLHHNYRTLHSPGGFGDAFSLVDDWFFKQRIAIDQAPIVIMIENYRTGFVWNLLEKSPEIKRGLELAKIASPKYKTGFQHAISDIRTGSYDMIMHPDREQYEIDFSLENDADVSFQIINSQDGKEVINQPSKRYKRGEHLLSFGKKSSDLGGKYSIEMYVGTQKTASVNIILH